MPQLFSANLLERVVLWEYQGNDAYGDPVCFSPIEIMCRLDNNSRQIVDPLRGTIQTVADLIVDREIPMLSIIWPGPMIELPANPTGLLQIVFHDSTPDLKHRFSLLSLSCIRYKDQVPTVVGSGS